MRYLFLTLLFLSLSAFAKGRSSELKDGSFVFYFGGDVAFSTSKADSVAGATYTNKYNNSMILDAGLGVRLFRYIYIGTRYEYSLLKRAYTVGGVETQDKLDYQNIGGEIGWVAGNPRVHWILSVGGFFPLALDVAQVRNGTTTHFINAQKPITYQGRLTLGVKMNSAISFRFEGGYRMQNVGNLQSNGSSYLNGGEKLDLSGPFFGFGLGLHF